jgi:hypothetical protein
MAFSRDDFRGVRKVNSDDPAMKSRRQDQKQAREIRATQSWRLFLFLVLLAVLCGMSIRLHFSPERLRGWMEEAIAAQPVRMNLAFGEARLRLANGALPQVAVELTQVRVIAAPDCQNQPSLTIARLRVPLRLSQLLLGRVAFGTVAAEDVVLDVDGFRSKCEIRPDSGLPEAVPNAVVANPSPPSADGSQPWWTEAQFESLAQTIEGVSFSRVNVEFERRSKIVQLDSFQLKARANKKDFHLRSHVKVPKELTQGEQLPDFEISADVKADRALVSLKGRVSEGKIAGEAEVTPLPNRELKIASKLSVSSLPLSTVVPLLTRAAVIKREMKPKFLWLNCEAEIAGRFQGLFLHNPLELKNCEVSGNGSKIRVDHATRLPGGRWGRFTGTIESADMRQMLETFSVTGLEGIATDFGKFDGHVEVENERSARLVGNIDGMRLRFSNHSERTVQSVRNIAADVSLHEDGRLTGEISKMEVEGGVFDGRVDFEFSKGADRGRIHLAVQKLKFRDEVQRLMVEGTLETIQGDLTAELIEGQLKELKGLINLKSLQAEDWTFANLQVVPSVSKSSGVVLNLKSPELRLRSSSPIYIGAQSALFGKPFAATGVSEVPIRDVQVLAEVPLEGGFRWLKASGLIEQGRVRLTSEGRFNREHVLEGHLMVDYPLVKKLRWGLSGTVEDPSFTFQEISAGEKFNELVRQGGVTEKTLGLSERN